MCQNKHHSNAFKKETEFDYNLYMEIQDSTSVPAYNFFSADTLRHALTLTFGPIV